MYYYICVYIYTYIYICVYLIICRCTRYQTHFSGMGDCTKKVPVGSTLLTLACFVWDVQKGNCKHETANTGLYAHARI